MKLNIQLILDWFSQHGADVQAKLLDESCELENIRYLTNGDDLQSKKTLYVVPNSGTEEGTILVYHDGVIYLKDLEPEYVFHELHAIIQYYQQIESQIISATLEEKPLQRLAEIAASVFETTVVIEGMDATILAASRRDPEESPNMLRSISCDHLLNDPTAQSEFYGQKNCFLECSVRYLDHQIGRILIYRYPHALSRGIVQFLEVFRTMLESIITLYPSRYLHALYLEQMLTPVLQGEAADFESLQNALSNLGWPIDSEYQIAVIGEFDSYDSITNCTAWLRQKRTGLYYIPFQQEVFVLCNLTADSGVMTHLRQYIGDNETLHMGISYCFTELHQLNQMYRQAKRTLGIAKTVINRTCTAEESAFAVMSELLSQDDRLSLLSDPDVELLRNYDAEHQTAYLTTLQAWILCKCNYVQCAAHLKTHTNTVRYRISKIEEMISANLFDPRDRARLLTSILISR